MEAVTAPLLATGTVTETMTTTAAGTITHTVVRKLVVDISRKEVFAVARSLRCSFSPLYRRVRSIPRR